MRTVSYVGVAVALALAVAVGGFAAGPPDDERLSPVPFDQTITSGLTGVDVQQALANDHVIPRGEVFYSQYEYVVGYYGLDALVAGVSGSRHTDQFGDPLAVFVTDLSDTGPDLTDDGYVTLSDPAALRWTRAEDAWFVVDTPARTPGGPTAVPFGDRADARGFAVDHGGTVVDWERIRAGHTGRRDVSDRRVPTTDRLRWADATVTRATRLRRRPTSLVVGTEPRAVEAAVTGQRPGSPAAGVVVGEDVPTLAAAIERAPANTTVEVLPGRYDANLTITKPITLRGAGDGTVLDGGGRGSIVTVRSPRVGIAGVRLVGIGDSTGARTAPDNGSAWDRRIRLTYGYGDAAVRLSDADRSLVENVTIETAANGVVALDSTGAVVRNVTVDGTEAPGDGYMGVLPMYSRMVIEESAFDGGRDAVYTHYADGTVVRNNRMTNLRYGYHEMYTSDTLAFNNTVRNAETGIVLMTRPTGNVLVGNDIRNSTVGISTAGSASIVTDNVLATNELGLSIGTSRSIYRDNTVLDNHVGIRLTSLLPTNDVFGNDVVANDRPVSADVGALTTWSIDGRGNYWGSIPGIDRDGDGVVDRTYRPTDRVDRAARHSGGSYALSRAPILRAVRRFQRAVPGLRSASVVDPSPLAAPVHPERLEETNGTTT